MVELRHASTFLACLGDERSAVLAAEIEGRWDEIRDQIEAVLRPWCASLAVEPSHRNRETTDHLLSTKRTT